MNIRYATEQEITHWNDHINNNPDGGNILQGKEFIEIKAITGWNPRYIFVNDRAIAIVEKYVPLLGKLWYCPKGPSTTSVNDLVGIMNELRKFASQHGVFTIKIEPELDHTTDMSPAGFLTSKPVQQNWATVYVDLSPTPDEIIMNLNQKARHAIRRAERDGVTVKAVPSNAENCQIMYEMFQETATSAGFPIRPAAYYQTFYELYEKAGYGQLFFAYVDDKVVTGAFAMVQGEKSIYKDGASVRDRPVYGSSHLLQWHVMLWAKEQGSHSHDLCGVPPIAQAKDPAHPFSGLGRFKTSFNKEITEYVGAFDVPVRPLQAKIWHKIGEKLVRRLYFERHRQSYY